MMPEYSPEWHKISAMWLAEPENRTTAFLESLYIRCVEEGRGFTKKQYSVLQKIIQERSVRKEANREVQELPEWLDNVQITGIVKRLNWKENRYGSYQAVIVELDSGKYKGCEVWFRTPQSLRVGVRLEIGNRVLLTLASLTRSADNHYLGFGKRAKDALVIG